MKRVIVIKSLMILIISSLFLSIEVFILKYDLNYKSISSVLVSVAPIILLVKLPEKKKKDEL